MCRPWPKCMYSCGRPARVEPPRLRHAALVHHRRAEGGEHRCALAGPARPRGPGGDRRSPPAPPAAEPGRADRSASPRARSRRAARRRPPRAAACAPGQRVGAAQQLLQRLRHHHRRLRRAADDEAHQRGADLGRRRSRARPPPAAPGSGRARRPCAAPAARARVDLGRRYGARSAGRDLVDLRAQRRSSPGSANWNSNSRVAQTRRSPLGRIGHAEIVAEHVEGDPAHERVDDLEPAAGPRDDLPRPSPRPRAASRAGMSSGRHDPAHRRRVARDTAGVSSMPRKNGSPPMMTSSLSLVGHAERRGRCRNTSRTSS